VVFVLVFVNKNHTESDISDECLLHSREPRLTLVKYDCGISASVQYA